MLVFDLETHLIEQDANKVPTAPCAPRIVCVALKTDRVGGVAIHTRDTLDQAVATIEDTWAAGECTIGHNIAFDLGCLAATFPRLIPVIFSAYERGLIIDTKIREQLISIAMGTSDRRGFDLGALVKTYEGITLTGKKGPDVWRLKYAQLDGVPLEHWPPAAKAYCVSDVEHTWAVYDAQERLNLTTEAGRSVMPLADEKAQTQAAWALHLIGLWGMKIDPEAAAAWVAEVKLDADQALSLAKKAGFIRGDGTKDLSVLRGMLEKAYGSSVPRTEKGAIKTDETTVKNSGHPVLMEYCEFKFAEKLNTTYAPILSRPTVHPSYGVLVKTGRTSCKKPNMQNPPRAGGFRGCFMPRPGTVFVLCDLAQVELLALGQIHFWMFGRSSIIEAVNAGRDLHLEVAAQLNPADPAAYRQFSKVANYGFPGGLSADSFVAYAKGYGLSMTSKEAHALRTAWLNTWEEMRAYFKDISTRTQWGNTTIIQWISERQRGGCSYTQAANGYFQALVADGCKAALWEVQKQAYTQPASDLYGCRGVAFLHDEIILEAPIGVQAGAAAVALERTMIEAMNRFLPDVTVSADAYCSARWTKEAPPTPKQHEYHNGAWRAVP